MTVERKKKSEAKRVLLGGHDRLETSRCWISETPSPCDEYIKQYPSVWFGPTYLYINVIWTNIFVHQCGYMTVFRFLSRSNSTGCVCETQAESKMYQKSIFVLRKLTHSCPIFPNLSLRCQTQLGLPVHGSRFFVWIVEPPLSHMTNPLMVLSMFKIPLNNHWINSLFH